MVGLSCHLLFKPRDIISLETPCGCLWILSLRKQPFQFEVISLVPTNLRLVRVSFYMLYKLIWFLQVLTDWHYPLFKLDSTNGCKVVDTANNMLIINFFTLLLLQKMHRRSMVPTKVARMLRWVGCVLFREYSLESVCSWVNDNVFIKFSSVHYSEAAECSSLQC